MQPKQRPQDRGRLDPPDWQSFRELGHRLVDEMVEHLESLAKQPAWREMPPGLRETFCEELPREGQGEERVCRELIERVLPFGTNNLHPRFFGWVQGTGVPLASYAEMLASAMNPHLAGFNQAPVEVENAVLRWLTELMGFPETASGLLVSGGSMANLLGLAVARQAGAGFDVREEGLQSASRPMMVVYCSTETHGWAAKSMELLGLGRRALRKIPVDAEHRLPQGELQRTIEADRRAGHQPICVIATAGTVNTGATDDLEQIADLCARESLWFHVDGAFGALARLSPRLAPRVAGLERADSLAFDLHKWMYLPFEIACVLVRDARLHEETFAMTASYLADVPRGVAAGGLPFARRGLDLTRSFKALKAWLCIKAYGIDTFAAAIEDNVAQAERLAELVRASDRLELLAPVPLNVVCFRYRANGCSEEELDALNQHILMELQTRGLAVPSGTRIGGRFAIRACFVNHRTTLSDVEALARATVDLGDELAESGEWRES